jgi:GGDEF domain-containing protein
MKLKHLERLATEDDLTDLKNRRYIWEFSRQIIEHARKGNGRVTLLVFDIDDFKHYNDVYGHCAGDEILRQAAVLMRRCCRGHDVVGRIGGDEFAVVFWDEPQAKPVGAPAGGAERRSSRAEHPKEVIFIAKRFIRELEKSELPALAGLGPEGTGVLTISGGLASFPRDGSTIQELFQQADKALLEAKRSGKNRIYLVGKPQSDIADIE